MKILAIGRNYVEHIEELNNERPSEPVVFTKPETALLKNNQPFYYPSISKDIHHEVEVLLKICKNGKNIEEKFAHKYYDQIGLGIDFTARDLQTTAKEKGLPWALAKGFNHSAPISEFRPKSDYKNLNSLYCLVSILLSHTSPNTSRLKKGILYLQVLQKGLGRFKLETNW